MYSNASRRNIKSTLVRWFLLAVSLTFSDINALEPFPPEEKALAWMQGTWQAQSDSSRIEVTFTSAENNQMLGSIKETKRNLVIRAWNLWFGQSRMSLTVQDQQPIKYLHYSNYLLGYFTLPATVQRTVPNIFEFSPVGNDSMLFRTVTLPADSTELDSIVSTILCRRRCRED